MKLSVEKQNFMIDLYLGTKDVMSERRPMPEVPSEVDEFLNLASRNEMSPRLYLSLKNLNLINRSEILVPLEKIYQQARLKNVRRLQVGMPILSELKNQNIDVIILKGNALAEDVFLDIGYKAMDDIDILVKREDLGAIYKIYQKNNLLSSIKKEEEYSHHWSPYFDQKLDLFLETYWNIAAPMRGLKIPLVQFWNEKEEFKLMGETYFRLSPKHFLLHQCVNLNAAKTGIRELGDLVKLIEVRQSDLNTSDFFDLTLACRAEKEVYEALSLVAVLSTSPFVTEILSNLNLVLDKKFKQRVLKRCIPRHKLLHIRSTYVSKIESTYVLFTLTQSPLKKTYLFLKIWKLFLWVPTDEALRLSYEMPTEQSLKRMNARLWAPIKISRVFSKEMGLPVFLIVVMRLPLMLFKSYWSKLRMK